MDTQKNQYNMFGHFSLPKSGHGALLDRCLEEASEPFLAPNARKSISPFQDHCAFLPFGLYIA